MNKIRDIVTLMAYYVPYPLQKRSMDMRVEASNGMIFDDADPLCKCIIESSGGKYYAFVQCIDTGMNGEDRFTKRYWGEFNRDNPESSISRIMLQGGKWPNLPSEALGWHLPEADAQMPEWVRRSSQQYQEGFAYAIARDIGEASPDDSVSSACPYSTGSPQHDAWVSGYDRGCVHVAQEKQYGGA